MPPSRSRMDQRRWPSWALLAYGILVVGALIVPVGYGKVVQWIADGLRESLGLGFFGSGWIEFTANIAMFVPLGFLLTLVFRHHWYGVALALGLSVFAEVAQIIIPSRQPSLRDILANLLGAAIGAGLAWLIVLRRDNAMQRRMAASDDNGRAGDSGSPTRP